jgi:hypothetical protein
MLLAKYSQTNFTELFFYTSADAAAVLCSEAKQDLI